MAEQDTNPQQTPQPASSPAPEAPKAAPLVPPVPAISVDQAKQAAEKLTGGLKQGMDQLQVSGVTQMFKVAANQPKVTMDEKLWAGLSYIPLVALAALVIKPESGYIKLHGRQGLLIFIVFFFCIFIYLVPYIGPLFGGLIQFGLFVVGVFSMYQAFIGNWWKIPVLGDIADMIPIGMFTKVTTEVLTGQPAPQEPVPGSVNEPAPVQPVEMPPAQPAGQEPVNPNPPPSPPQNPTAAS